MMDFGWNSQISVTVYGYVLETVQDRAEVTMERYSIIAYETIYSHRLYETEQFL